VTKSENSKTKLETLKLSIRPVVRRMIDRAAKLIGKHRRDFVLDTARQEAEEVIFDHTALTFSAEAYAEFVARLDAPPRPNDRLMRSLQTVAPWDQCEALSSMIFRRSGRHASRPARRSLTRLTRRGDEAKAVSHMLPPAREYRISRPRGPAPSCAVEACAWSLDQ